MKVDRVVMMPITYFIHLKGIFNDALFDVHGHLKQALVT